MADSSGFVGSLIVNPQTSTLRGSDFSGSDGQANRTYSISANTGAFAVAIDGQAKHKDVQFTYDGSTLTILDPLADASYIDIQHFDAP